jgi:hypothetical protein
VALPVEHGGWGFLAEPFVAGSLAAPGPAGLLLGVAALFGFLSRHPARLVWKNRDRLDASPRYRLALGFSVVYAVAALVAAAGVIALAGVRPLLPLLLLSPLLVAFVRYDLAFEGRRLLPEIAAPAGLAAVAPGMALAAGWSWPLATALWLLLLARAVPSILYVRGRLRLEKGKPVRRTPALLAHVAGAALAMLLAGTGLAPPVAAAGLVILLGRAVVGLSPLRRPARAPRVGLQELGFGLAYAVIVGLGYRLAG